MLVCLSPLSSLSPILKHPQNLHDFLARSPPSQNTSFLPSTLEHIFPMKFVVIVRGLEGDIRSQSKVRGQLSIHFLWIKVMAITIKYFQRCSSSLKYPVRCGACPGEGTKNGRLALTLFPLVACYGGYSSRQSQKSMEYSTTVFTNNSRVLSSLH